MNGRRRIPGGDRSTTGVKQMTLVSHPRSAFPALLDFEAVYDAEWNHVWKLLQRLGVPEEDLPDLTQEVFVLAFRAWDRCDFSRPIRPWLFGIAYRVMLGFRRLVRHSREVSNDRVVAPALGISSEDAVAQAERRQLFLDALEGMNLDRRAVLVLHEIEGYSAPEIAETLGEPLNTVYSRLRTARQELAEALRHLHHVRGPQ
jgi:RNA polymerase sigma-70 factor, ECF subfamily